ncbi:MAG: MurR/RpiR family transcriptional regulator [Burkholderiales bacterium]|nr:MurR/RpiR family transcriptional regulator [Burkholderiales bacterium]
MADAVTYEQLAGRITEAYPDLPERLQGIARFALGHPDAMALSTVAEIARESGAPPSAVIRFANALGFSGFTELSRIYRERLVARSSTYRERIEQLRRTGGDQGHVLPQLVDSSIRELERLREHLDPGNLRAAARVVRESDAVFLLAQRRAFPVASYLAYGLAQLEFRAFLLDSVGGMLRQQAGMLRPGNVLIAASFRSYAQEVIDAARAAHGKGATVVAITDQQVSPLARFAKVTLLVGDDPTVQFRSLVAPLCAAQALVMTLGYAIAERNGRGAAKKSRKALDIRHQ